MTKTLVIITCFFIPLNLLSQISKNDSINNLYKETIKIANELYKNKHYNESVSYYKAAKRLNPNEKLPQFRLEDIKTIFIKYDIAANKEEAQKIIDKIKEKTAIENKKNKSDNFFYDIDTSALAKNRENQKNIDSLISYYNINKDTLIKQKSKKNTTTNKTIITSPVLFDKKDTTNIPDKINISQKPETKQNNDTTKINKKQNKKISKPVIDEEKINKELAKKYPNTKTVENITAKHKKIKKVIINKNGKVTIYLKVMHDWGGIYYFVDKSYLQQKNQDITQREFYAQTGEN